MVLSVLKCKISLLKIRLYSKKPKRITPEHAELNRFERVENFVSRANFDNFLIHIINGLKFNSK